MKRYKYTVKTKRGKVVGHSDSLTEARKIMENNLNSIIHYNKGGIADLQTGVQS